MKPLKEKLKKLNEDSKSSLVNPKYDWLDLLIIETITSKITSKRDAEEYITDCIQEGYTRRKAVQELNYLGVFLSRLK